MASQSLAASTTTIEISGISCSEIHNLGLFRVFRRPDSFYVKVIVNNFGQNTTASKRSRAPAWAESLIFGVDEDMVSINIQISARLTFGNDVLLGELEDPMTMEVISMNRELEYSRHIIRNDKKNRYHVCTVHFTLRRLQPSGQSFTTHDTYNSKGSTPDEQQTVMQGAQALQTLEWISNDALDEIADIYIVSETLLKQVEVFVEIVNKIAEIHPYAQLVWIVLSPALQALISQSHRDHKIAQLLETMHNIYKLILVAEPLKKMEVHKEVIKRILQQTYECSWFIRDYSSHSFVSRLTKAVSTNHDSRVQAYIDTFAQLKESFMNQSTVFTEITVFRALAASEESLAIVQNILAIQYLNDLPRATYRFVPTGCLAGTRTESISEIATWANSPINDSTPRLFWLSGVAGCGKTAIAQTITEQFRALKRCVSFFFNASRQSGIGPDCLFSTISRDLADLDVYWKASLLDIIKDSLWIRQSSSEREQFENLILRPSKHIDVIGPILVVIDALDESGTETERERMLEMLTRVTELPSQFRFLVTSRPERDILNAFSGKDWVLSRNLDHVDPNSTDHDITCYVRNRLSGISDLKRKWPDDEWVSQIVTRSGHLFQWAFTACEYVRGVAGGKGLRPTERLEQLLGLSARPDQGLIGLYKLYKTILEYSFDFQDGDTSSHRFKTILGRILSLREPLSLTALTALRLDTEDDDEVKLVLYPLGSLLRGVSREDEPIQPLHASFADFLRDVHLSGRYHIEAGSQDENIAQTSLREMHKLLRFNICNIGTSHLRNRDMEDLPQRIVKYIPAHLSYACRYWVDHLCSTAVAQTLSSAITEFLRTKLLLWFEVLSLLQQVDRAAFQLQMLGTWTKDQIHGRDTEALVVDAGIFARTFGSVMRQSTPHIYLSLLAFIPVQSPLFQCYSNAFPGSLTIENKDRRHVGWTPALLNVQTTEPILAIAISPNSRRIISGGMDGNMRMWDAETGESIDISFGAKSQLNDITDLSFTTDGKSIVCISDDLGIRTWNAETGELVAAPFLIHDSSITAIASSPNGTCVASSQDMTIRIWDIKSGCLIAGPFHTTLKEAVHFITFSPDGSCFALAAGQDIWIWNARGEIVAGPLQGHTWKITSISFSFDGTRIVSGSWDGTIRIWDVKTRKLIGYPLQGHKDVVMSVVFSPMGNYIASCSRDQSIQIWSAHTGQPIGSALLGHKHWVTSIAFSLDGKRLVSGSRDQCIRLWDVDSIAHATIPSNARGYAIRSITFSPSGDRIASGSTDQTVRVWDMKTGKAVVGPCQGHAHWITCVAFSSCGNRIASGSGDFSVRIWDANTGEIVAGPCLGHKQWVTTVAFSPDGARVASGGDDQRVAIWDTETGKLLAGPFYAHARRVRSIAFSPDGTQLVSGSDDKSVKIWDLATGIPIGSPFAGHTSCVSSVAFHPRQNRVLSGSWDQSIRIWDTKTGGLVIDPIMGHTDRVRSVAFSPDGDFIVSGSDDRTVRVWCAKTGKLMAGPFYGHSDRITSVVFSPDGSHIASGAWDNSIRIWNIAEYINSNDSNGVCELNAFATGSAQNPIQLEMLKDTSEMKDGWVLGSSGELLFWIPPDYRSCIWRPSNTAVIGPNPIRLNLTRFVHGQAWAQCYQPQS